MASKEMLKYEEIVLEARDRGMDSVEILLLWEETSDKLDLSMDRIERFERLLKERLGG